MNYYPVLKIADLGVDFIPASDKKINMSYWISAQVASY